MNAVTVIETLRKRKGRVQVILDNGTTFTLSFPLAVEAGVHQGQRLSAQEIERLKDADGLQVSMDAALRYLSPRPRSEAEMRARLNRRGFDADTIDETIKRLRERGLVDDASFAEFWRDNRESFRPLSRRLIGLELRRKGVDDGTIAETTAEMEDEGNAYRAASRKARALTGLDYPDFSKRLVGFLRRRGFDYELVGRTVDRLWKEQVDAHSN